MVVTVIVAASKGAQGAAEYEKAMNDVGAAQRMAARMTDNLKGDFGLVAGRVFDAGPSYTFSGVSVLHPALFEDAPKGAFKLAKRLRKAVENHQVTAELFTGYWSDVGTHERLAQLEMRIGGGA